MQTELEHEKERYAAFIRNSHEGIWRFEIDQPISTDLPIDEQITECFEQGYLAEANDAMGRMYGFESSEPMIGARLPDLMPRDDPQNIAYLRAWIENDYSLNGVETREVDKHGNDKYFRNSLVGIVENGCIARAWGTQHDVTQLRHADDLAVTNLKLKSQRTQLLALNKTKDEFIALASHQLRTPATAVKQYLGMLLDDFAGPLTADQTQFLQIAFDSNERQLNIISDLLKTAQIDSQMYRLKKSEQDIGNIVKQAAAELEATLELMRHRIEWNHFKPASCLVDTGEIKLVFVNLLENASKYSYPGSPINVSMRLTEKYVDIAIHDHGVGVAKPDQRRIFDKFTRVDNDLSDTVTGTGFGLYWAKRIVGLHGGHIRVRSTSGVGSTFTVRLNR